MIHANRIVTVGDQESIIDRPIVLYRGDREVEIEFTLVGNEFTFSEEGNVIKSVNASHGQLVLNTPSGEHMFSELAECHEGKVVFVVTKEMIDEFIEMGFYSFQIRLYDSAEMKSRVTIPPVMNGFDIRNPIAAEDETNVVDQGIVDYARVFKDQSNEELPTFDWTGAYNKTEWAHHDVITETKLNKIEDALYSINANVKESDVAMLNTLDQVKKDADKYVKEHMAEVEQDVEDFERNLNTGVEKFKIDTNAAMTTHKNEVSEELARKVNQTDLDSEIVSRRVRGQNNPNSPAGTFDFANFAQQGQETGLASTPIGGVIHHYTDGKVLQIDNVGENNVILTMVNANNTSRRPDKDSTFYGKGYFMQLFTNNQNKRDDEITGGVYPHLTIDEKGMLFWSGYTPTGVKTNSTLFTTGKDHGYTPAYIFKCTKEHEILMQLQNTDYAVMNFKWNKTVNCGEINAPSDMNGLNINTITGDIRMSPQNGNLRIDNIAYINKKDSRGAKQIAIIDFGTTEERPTTNLECGMMYFDRTLNKPIWRNASNNGWVDATGQSV